MGQGQIKSRDIQSAADIHPARHRHFDRIMFQDPTYIHVSFLNRFKNVNVLNSLAM